MKTPLVSLLAAVVLGPISSDGAPRASSLVIGETGGSPETRAVLRRLLVQESDRSLHALVVPTNAARFELTGSARLVRVPDATGVVLSCEVSLLLVERPAGTVRALLRGSAHLARDRKRPMELGGDGADVEAAMRIAVRGALRPLPEALGLERGLSGESVSPQQE